MFLKSITLKNFKKFSGEHKIEFPADITIIKANNEQGKSSLVEAITAVFFEDPKSEKSEIMKYQTWGKKEMPKIIAEFEDLPEGNFEIIKDFGEKEVLLKNLETGEETKNIKQVQDKIFNMIGIKNRKIMEGTAVVRQDEVGKIELKSAIEDLVTSAERGVKISDIIKNLNEAISNLEKGVKKEAKKPGKIKEFFEKIRIVEERLKILTSQNEKAKNLVDKKNKLEKFYQERVKSLELKESLHKDNFEIYKIEEETQKEESRFNEIEKKINLIKEIKSLLEKAKEKIGAYAKFSKISVSDLENELKEKKSRKQSFESIIEKIKSREKFEFSKKAESRRKLAKPLFVVAVVLGFVGVFGFFISIALTVVLFLIAIAIFVVSLIFSRKHISEHDIEFSEAEKNLKIVSSDLAGILKKFGEKNFESLLLEINEFKKVKKDIDELNLKFEVFGGEEELNRLESERKKSLKKIGIDEEKINDLKPKKISPVEFSRLEKEIKLLKEEISKVKSEIDDIGGQLKTNEHNIRPEELEELEENKIEFNESLKYWQSRLKIFEKLKELLIESQNNTYGEVKDTLQNSIGTILNIITSGKYKKVSLDETFNLKVFSEEKGEEILPQNYLSGGAIDQSFLAARLSFLKLISGSKKPFIILDDPFHSFDEIRREETRKIIQDFSADFQIIILTCHGEYDDWGVVSVIKDSARY